MTMMTMTPTMMTRLGPTATVLLLLATTTTRTTTTNAFHIHPTATRATVTTTATATTITTRNGRRSSSSSSSSSSCTPSSILFMSDQWDDELPVAVTSFDDATRGMLEEQEQKDLEAMGGYDDIVPGSEFESQEKVRNAIRARTGVLGMEESQVSKEFIAEAAARAAMRGGSGSSMGGLDLSKVSDGSSQILSINYDPEDEMTEEEKLASDPLGYKPFTEQLNFELGETTFPDIGATFSRVVLLVALAFSTGFLIIETDALVRELYMSKGFIPRPEDIMNAKDAGLKLSQELAAKVVEKASDGLSLPDIGL